MINDVYKILTEDEWMKAIMFLTKTGQKCDDRRQEFILLSDVLGVSMLLDAINNRKSKDETETTVLGPFHAPSPTVTNGENIAKSVVGDNCIVSGNIMDTDKNPFLHRRNSFRPNIGR